MRFGFCKPPNQILRNLLAMRSRTLRIIFGTVLVWSLLLGLCLNNIVKAAVQLAQIEHQLVDHDESLMDILKCLTHDDTQHTSTSDSEHHRNHDHTGPKNCGTGCIAQVAVPPRTVVLPPINGGDRIQSRNTSVDLYISKPQASIFQPPRA